MATETERTTLLVGKRKRFSIPTTIITVVILLLLTTDNIHQSYYSPFPVVHGFHILLAGGTGPVGKTLSSSLANDGHQVTILCRNAFLAGTPSRSSGDFGWLGRGFLEKHSGNIRLRDWDGGDLLDIVGKDFLGWQEDALASSDAVVNLVGGYTVQREMAAERLVRESLRVNPTALQMTVGPRAEELSRISPGAYDLKVARLLKCEEYVKLNCVNYECLRLEANRVEEGCDRIKKVIYDRLKEKKES
jgi:hypothetical protein